MNQLQNNLYVKHPLTFQNGKFTVLAVSDMHGIKNFDTRVVRDMDALVETVKPDLVLLLGDTVWRDGAENPEALRAFLSALVKPMEQRSIPWASVFGNHDAEKGFSVSRQQSVYEEFEYCVSKRGPAHISGTANFVLPIKNETGKILYNVWGLDSHRDIGDFLREAGLPDDKKTVMLPDPLYVSQSYDTVRFDQMMWYWNSSVELEEYNGGKIPGLMVMHIPIPEYIIPYKNTAQCRYIGNRREAVGSSPVNPGLFSCILQRGDVKTLIAGHDHINDCEGEYLGVRLTYDAGIGYDGYCDEDLRGGRVVEIDENDPWHIKTYMVRAKDCVQALGMEYPGVALKHNAPEKAEICSV